MNIKKRENILCNITLSFNCAFSILSEKNIENSKLR